MINRKLCQCYLCRGKIQVGHEKRKVHGTNYAHSKCKRVKKSKLWFGRLFGVLNGKQ